MLFNQLGLLAELLRAVHAQGYETATPVQHKAIPPILEGRDILAGAQHSRLAVADVPTEVLPSAGAGSSTSKLIEELADSGLLDDVCDPINCNPVFSFDPPATCPPTGPPPEGCVD